MIGKQLGHYQILEKIGAGGMGDVYAAQDEKLNRKVALKILPPAMAANPERRARFEREAKAVAALNHPNIVTIFSVEKENGTHFITMEYVEGRPLSALMGGDGMPVNEVFELAVPILDAITSAHEQGIAHRDLKPDNIMVTANRGVKILDFGLAKLLHPILDDPEAGTMVGDNATQEGRILGTTAYMSPEQAEGKPVDQRTDIFSLGIILYEMTTGRRPFHGDTGLSTLSSILKDEPASVTDLKQELPHHLGRIIHRCLAKDPRRRYQTALDVKNELEGLKEETTSDLERRPASAATTASKQTQNKTPLFLGGAAVLIALAIWFLGPWRGTEIPGENTSAIAEESSRKSIVVFPFENLGAPEDAYFAAGMTEEITSRLAIVNGLSVMSRTSAVQYDKTGKTMQKIGADLGVEYVLEGTVRWQRSPDGTSRVRVTPQLIRVSDDSHLWADRYDRTMEEIFEVQSDIAKAVVQQLDLTLVLSEKEALEAPPTENTAAYHAYLRGKELTAEVRTTEESHRQAVRLYERAIDLDPEFLLAYVELAKTHSAFCHFEWDRSPERLSLAKENVDRTMELDPESPWAHVARGYYFYWGQKDYANALDAFGRAEKILNNNTEVLVAIAFVRRRQGDFTGALSYMERALELDPRNPNLYLNIGQTQNILRNYMEAAAAFDQAISMAPSSVYSFLGKVTNLFLWKADLAAMRAVLESSPDISVPEYMSYRFDLEFCSRNAPQAMEVARSMAPSVRTQLIYLSRHLYLGLVHDFLDQSPAAHAHYDSAATVFEDLAEKEPDNGLIRTALGLAYAGLGRKQDAIRETKSGLEMFPYANDAWIAQYGTSAMIFVLIMTGEHDQALDLLEEALAGPSHTISRATLGVDPRYDSIRDLPRFQKLVNEAS